VPQRSTSTISQPAAAADDATPTQTGQQYHYLGDIQLGRIQRASVADHYETLTPQTQGEQYQRDFTSPHQKNKIATDYVNLRVH